MVQRPATHDARCTGHGIDGALVRIRPQGGLLVHAITVLAPVASVKDEGRTERRRVAVVPVDQEGALVRVTVAGEHQVHAVALQYRQRVRPHFDQPQLGVRVVGAAAVGRMVPERDGPVLRRCGQIRGGPSQHGPGNRTIGPLRVQHHEVDVAVVERVVGLGARGKPSGRRIVR